MNENFRGNHKKVYSGLIYKGDLVKTPGKIIIRKFVDQFQSSISQIIPKKNPWSNFG